MSFFSDLFKGIGSIAGTIIGGMFGGPAGALLGGTIGGTTIDRQPFGKALLSSGLSYLGGQLVGNALGNIGMKMGNGMFRAGQLFGANSLARVGSSFATFASNSLVQKALGTALVHNIIKRGMDSFPGSQPYQNQLPQINNQIGLRSLEMPTMPEMVQSVEAQTTAAMKEGNITNPVKTLEKIETGKPRFKTQATSINSTSQAIKNTIFEIIHDVGNFTQGHIVGSNELLPMERKRLANLRNKQKHDRLRRFIQESYNRAGAII